MKLYNSYIKKSPNKAIEDIVLVKNGFSFFAFLFNILWFFYNRMWRESIAILIIGYLLIEISEKTIFGNFEAFIIMTGFLVIIAINANHWYSSYLRRKNYLFAGYVFGRNREAAKLRFIHNLTKEEGGRIISNSSLEIKNKKNISNSEESYFIMSCVDCLEAV